MSDASNMSARSILYASEIEALNQELTSIRDEYYKILESVDVHAYQRLQFEKAELELQVRELSKRVTELERVRDKTNRERDEELGRLSRQVDMILG